MNIKRLKHQFVSATISITINSFGLGYFISAIIKNNQSLWWLIIPSCCIIVSILSLCDIWCKFDDFEGLNAKGKQTLKDLLMSHPPGIVRQRVLDGKWVEDD